MSRLNRIVTALGMFALSTLAFAGPALDGIQAKQPTNWHAIGMFCLFVALTMGITYWASGRTKSTADFYTAGGGITGFQNGLAIAGDYMSAATLLGLSAMVYTQGYDGYIYMLAFFAGWPIILFLMAERLRNMGKFTFSDITAYRLDQGKVRTMAAISSLTVVCFYLLAQMVGAGQLIKLLFGLDYNIAIFAVGLLMMVYVIFGGMVATTWVQIIKACMLLAGVTFMAFMVMAQFGFSPEALFAKGVEVRTLIAGNTQAAAVTAAAALTAAANTPELVAAAAAATEKANGLNPAKIGLAIMGPGGFVKDPISAISFGMALMFGTAGLPHILMRFFTVPDAKQARKSVLWATTWIGYFYVLIFLIGFGAITLVLTNPEFANVATGVIKGGGGSANMAAVLVAKAVGGNVFFGFISAVAFATILAVVAGLTLSGASAVSHDIYATLIKKGKADSASELKVSRYTTVALGIVAVALGIAFEKQNIAFMVSLAFAIAASANFPVLFMAVLWKDCTTKGAVIGGFMGLISSVGLTIVSPSVWEATLGNPKGSAWFPYSSPALFSMTIGFVGTWLFSIMDRSANAAKERAAFPAQQVRSETGLGASGASGH